MREKRFFEKIEKSKLLQLVFCVVSMSLILGIYCICGRMIDVNHSRRYTVVEDKNLIKYVEGATIEGNRLVITGW